ncbi:helix-turn-helix domain-containing protein [Streptomyces sp. NPDC026206]|uniref:AraC-like ligand-binding domain-containing protein n=1 Tax=Streptomyces sp. NPDC026206 TaxID=3157089 RepID=UPI003410C6EA
MLSEDVFRSEELPVAERFDRWRERMGRTHAPIDLSSDHASDFRAHQRLIGLGAMSVSSSTFQPVLVQRTPRLIRRSDPGLYHVSLLLGGEGEMTCGRQRFAYRAYDFQCVDSSQSHEIWTGRKPITTLAIAIPHALLPLPRSEAGRLTGRPMSGREGIGALLAQFLTRLEGDATSYRPADGPRLATVLTDLVAALFAHSLDADRSLPPETRQRVLVTRIRGFIQRHLHDPQLTPRTVAAAHHISTSYLHRLFQDEGETVAASIRRQRLHHARHDLADPAQRGIPVHAIAARWGFPRATDFTRAFRSAYGVPPTDFRHRAHAGRG